MATPQPDREPPPDEPPDRAARAFVDTYDSRSYADPWTAIVDYRRVQAYQVSHPDDGRHAVGTALDLPPSRVRGWLNGGMPDVMRGYSVAQERGWLPFEPATATGRGLTVLCAWIYAGGSIDATRYQTLFAIGDETERALLERAADAAALELAESRGGGDGRAEEVRPAAHGPVLGRLLAALGAPVGEKNATATVVLPEFLSDAPERTRRVFVATYLTLRGQVERMDGHERLRFGETRSDRYLRSLAALLADVLGDEVWHSGRNIVLSAGATETYRSWEHLDI